MSSISTHVLDLVKGGPAEGVPVILEQLQGEEWVRIHLGDTDADGRIKDLVPRGWWSATPGPGSGWRGWRRGSRARPPPGHPIPQAAPVPGGPP